MKILGISGSIRKESLNTALLREAQKLAPKGVEVEIYIPNKLPLFSQDLENDLPKEVKELKEKIVAAQAILFACPEHNYSITAALKNVIEWGNRPWGDNSWDEKKAAIMGAGGGAGTARAQLHLRQIFIDLNVKTFNRPEVLIPKARERFDEKGNLIDEGMKKRVKELVEALVAFTSKNSS